MAKKKFRCCTHCFKNFPEELWVKNRGCPFCKWEQSECPFEEVGVVKPGDPWPCYIENDGKILINKKPVELVEKV